MHAHVHLALGRGWLGLVMPHGAHGVSSTKNRISAKLVFCPVSTPNAVMRDLDVTKRALLFLTS